MNTENSPYRTSKFVVRIAPKLAWRLKENFDTHHPAAWNILLTISFAVLASAVAFFVLGCVPGSVGVGLRIAALVVVGCMFAFRSLLEKRNVDQERSNATLLQLVTSNGVEELWVAVYTTVGFSWIVLAILGLVAFVSWSTFDWNLWLLARLAASLVVVSGGLVGTKMLRNKVVAAHNKREEEEGWAMVNQDAV
jgi:uncharacterized membrane protein